MQINKLYIWLQFQDSHLFQMKYSTLTEAIRTQQQKNMSLNFQNHN